MKLGPETPDGAPLVEIIEREVIYDGWPLFERIVCRARNFDGGWGAPMQREVYSPGQKSGSRVVMALPYDAERDVIVLNEQFRLAAHFAGELPYLLELSAGYIDGDETAEAAAIREVREETGMPVRQLEYVTRFMPSAGHLTEHLQAFIARVDSAQSQALSGKAAEGEFIRTHILPVADVIELLDQGYFISLSSAMMLHWFARHHQQIRRRWLAA